jgi:Family of unknown function (DUF5764)
MKKHIKMDDFQPSTLYHSRDELCARLVSILTPLVIEGIKSIFNESLKMCIENKENEKYLMHFQNLVAHIPKWNANTIETERKRIIERSGCNYLEELITCVHIIHLKVLTCIRVGNKQKKIDISIPKLDHFLHKVYINVARKTYMNVYLFERGPNVTPLQIQKNNREFEVIVQECIMNTIRDSIPTEDIIRAYTDESVEIEEEVVIENIEEPSETQDDPENKTGGSVDKSNDDLEKIVENALKEEGSPSIVPSIQNTNNDPVTTKLSFNDIDHILDTDTGTVQEVEAPKDIERLEEISMSRAIQRKMEEEEEEEEDRIKIHTDEIDLNSLDIFDINKDESKISEDLVLEGIEEL